MINGKKQPKEFREIKVLFQELKQLNGKSNQKNEDAIFKSAIKKKRKYDFNDCSHSIHRQDIRDWVY